LNGIECSGSIRCCNCYAGCSLNAKCITFGNARFLFNGDLVKGFRFGIYPDLVTCELLDFFNQILCLVLEFLVGYNYGLIIDSNFGIYLPVLRWRWQYLRTNLAASTIS